MSVLPFLISDSQCCVFIIGFVPFLFGLIIVFIYENYFFNLILEVIDLLLRSTSTPLLVKGTRTAYYIDEYHLLHLECSFSYIIT